MQKSTQERCKNRPKKDAKIDPKIMQKLTQKRCKNRPKNNAKIYEKTMQKLINEHVVTIVKANFNTKQI